MRNQLILATAILASAVVAPAWAAGHGRTSGQAAQTMSAQAGQNGVTARTAARANSQGAAHASQNAIDHVQNSPGQANNNSVLGNGGTTTTTTAASGNAAMTANAGMSAGTSDTGTGVSNRTAARANSQGPVHASQNAIDHVQNSPGQANNNSVLGNGGATTTTDATAATGGTKVATTRIRKPKKH